MGNGEVWWILNEQSDGVKESQTLWPGDVKESSKFCPCKLWIQGLLSQGMEGSAVLWIWRQQKCCQSPVKGRGWDLDSIAMNFKTTCWQKNRANCRLSSNHKTKLNCLEGSANQKAESHINVSLLLRSPALVVCISLNVDSLWRYSLNGSLAVIWKNIYLWQLWLFLDIGT